MESHCRPFSFFPPVILLVFEFIFKILLIIAVRTEILLLQDEEPVTQVSSLEVDKPLGIKGKALLTGFKMKMRTGRAAGRATESNDIPGIYPLIFPDLPF